jgi:hypothetical protein
VDNTERVAQLYEDAEKQTAQAMERLVGSQGFGTLMGQLAENAAALAKLGSDMMDLTLRNLRLAGRRDIVRLSRQLTRNEDKLERVLQELESLRDEVSGASSDAGAPSNGRRQSPHGATSDS